ncbi:MAG: glycosyltransferase family 4 protein [Pirellulales bacterium]|nr:glycosyltransferase family 4 protein [Pirellulales bacterium]
MLSHSKTTYMLVAGDCVPVGNGRQIELAVAGLIAVGHRVCVALVSSGGSLSTRLQALGASVRILNSKSSISLSVTAKVADIIRNERPQTVIGWGVETAGIICGAQVLTKLSRHSWRYIQQVSEPSLTVLQSVMVAQADQIIVTGESVWRSCKKEPSLQSITFVPPAAVAFDETVDREQVALQVGLDPSKKWTLCVAPLISKSRVDRLIWGFDQMAVTHNGLEHIVVGRGQLLQRLQRRAWVEEVSDSIHWFKYLPALPSLFRHVELILQCGCVAYGGCLLEGLSHGVPAVTVDTPLSRDVIGDSDAGILVPTSPGSEFARRATELLENEELRTRCSSAGKQRAKEMFDQTSSLSKLLEVLAS